MQACRLTAVALGSAVPVSAVARACPGEEKGTPAVRFTRVTNSTRRFFARPSSAALSATGLSWPTGRPCLAPPRGSSERTFCPGDRISKDYGTGVG
jgi:hypothetical protein